jgi:hypothetical protein
MKIDLIIVFVFALILTVWVMRKAIKFMSSLIRGANNRITEKAKRIKDQ